MGEGSRIGWTDHTFNPWWGCSRVSPGCHNCYAEATSKRFGFDVWGSSADRRFFGEAHWREPLKWDEQAAADGRPALVFCASMADVFEARPDLLEERARLFELMVATPHLRWLLLTKRPENVLELVPPTWRGPRLDVPGEVIEVFGAQWPANVGIGTTTEDQPRADERIPRLLEIPAPMRFLSVEPLLGPVDLRRWLLPTERVGWRDGTAVERRALSWIIVGGESGPSYRALDVDHARRVRDHAVGAAVPFFFKQHGGRTPTAGGDELDGRTWKEFPTWAGRS